MKAVFGLCSILFLFVCSSNSQLPAEQKKWLHSDSVLYCVDSPELAYPFQTRLDSAHTAFSNTAKKYFDNGATCVLPPTEKPVFFGVLQGKVVSFEIYLDYFLYTFPENSVMLVELELDWMGNIRLAKLKSYQGNIPRFFDNDVFFANLKALPAKYAGLPTDTRMILPLRRSKVKIRP